MEENKILSFLSLAKKAGKLKNGEFSVMEAIRAEVAGVVIIAQDASDNTKKKFLDKSNYRQIPVVTFSDKESLGAAIGKEYTATLAICDERMAKAFLEKYGRYSDGQNESI